MDILYKINPKIYAVIGKYAGLLSMGVTGAGIVSQIATGQVPEPYLFTALGLGMASQSALDTAAALPSDSELEKKL